MENNEIISRMSNRRLLDEFKKCIVTVSRGIYDDETNEAYPRLIELEEEIQARMAEIMDFE